MTTEVLNEAPNWLDKKFLETALRSGECDTSIIVNSCELTRATATGDNYMSDMFRANLHVTRGKDNEKENISVIVKCTPQHEYMEKFVSELGIFEREIEVFTTVLPELHRLLQEVSPGVYQPFGARCFYHQVVTNTSVIVLEDLKKQGFKMAERRLGLDFEHCLLVIRTMARYHAASIALHEKDPGYVKPFDFRAGLDNPSQKEKFDDFFSASLKSLADEIDTWPDSEDFYPEKLRKLADNIKGKVYEVVQRDDTEFNVLTHGDLWVNNIMFKYDSTNQLQDVRFVDYQIAHWTSPAIDILYFLHTSPNVSLWDKQDVFIKEYHKTLGEVLELFDLEHLHPTLQDLNRIIEERAFYALFAAVLILPIVLLDPEKPLDINDAIENDIQESIAKQKMHSSKEYKKAIRKLLPKLATKGLF